MIPKPKYLENILEIVKYKDTSIWCNVVCECGSKNFIGYKNVLTKSEEQKNMKSVQKLFIVNIVVLHRLTKTV